MSSMFLEYPKFSLPHWGLMLPAGQRPSWPKTISSPGGQGFGCCSASKTGLVPFALGWMPIIESPYLFTGSHNGLMPSGNKPLPDPNLCGHVASRGHNEFRQVFNLFLGFQMWWPEIRRSRAAVSGGHWGFIRPHLTHWTLTLEGNFIIAIFKLTSEIVGWGIPCEIALIWRWLKHTKTITVWQIRLASLGSTYLDHNASFQILMSQRSRTQT